MVVWKFLGTGEVEEVQTGVGASMASLVRVMMIMMMKQL